MEKATVFQSLQVAPYVQVPFPLSRTVLEEAMASFFRFLSLPEGIKSHIDWDIAPLHRRGDVGFKHRDPEEGPYSDSKDFFHFHPIIFEKYKDFLNDTPIVLDFMEKAHPIWKAVYEVVYRALESFTPDYPDVVPKIFETTVPHIQLRFLKYNWKASGKYLARPHFDAGSFTLALAESCAGLRIGRSPEDLQLIKHKENHALFMVSSNFKKVLECEALSPGWHDVIQLDKTKIGESFARWALVAFIEAADVEALSQTETHKWDIPLLRKEG